MEKTRNRNIKVETRSLVKVVEKAVGSDYLSMVCRSTHQLLKLIFYSVQGELKD